MFESLQQNHTALLGQQERNTATFFQPKSIAGAQNLIQKKDFSPAQPASQQGWENDKESFSKIAAEHNLMFERNVLSDSIVKITCTQKSDAQNECLLTTKKGLQITVLWATDTNRVIVKAEINGERKAYGYEYTDEPEKKPQFTLIKSWYY